MSRMKDLPSVNEGMQPDFVPEGLGSNSTSRAHHFVKRRLDSGMPTAGMTYLGFYGSAAGAEAARRNYIVIDKHGATYSDLQDWLNSTEVVELAEGEMYSPHGSGHDMIHGENDGATH